MAMRPSDGDRERFVFQVRPAQSFAGQCSTIKQPREIAHFSYDENHEYRPDDSGIRYYYPPKLNVNLSDGFEEFRQLPPADEHLISLLKCIQRLESKEGLKLDADFITWRGMITKIMTSLYDPYNDGYAMKATLYQGTIFIEEDFAMKMNNRRRPNAAPRATEDDNYVPRYHHNGRPTIELMMYWGYRFETLCSISDIWDNVSREEIESRPYQVVSNYAQYCSVAETSIAGHKLIIGGEVDGLWDCRPDDPQKPTNWVEFKTSAAVEDDRSLSAFERKLCSYWAQSFLIGVPKIIVGFRSPKGHLLWLEELHTMDIPRKVKAQGRSWDGNACINFTSEFLTFLKTNITGEGVWSIQRGRGNSYVELRRLTNEGTGEILTEDFKKWRETLLPSQDPSQEDSSSGLPDLLNDISEPESEDPAHRNKTEERRLALEVASLLGQSTVM